MSSIAAAFVGAFALVTPQDQPPPEPLPLLAHAALVEAMRAVERDNSTFARVVPIGTSRGGREIAALRVGYADAKPGTPAILVVGNIDGPQVYTSALVLHEAQELAQRATNQDETTQSLLATTTFFFVPRANPDAAEARFETPKHERIATGLDLDNDRDGRRGEDAPSDVDGDGQITWIRHEDPEGEWIADPLDERALVKADKNKGEIGRWKLWPEGRDLDHDEKVAEDSARDAVVNRNFAHDWKAHEAASGAFAMDEPEARALVEFVLLHPEIAMVVTYGELDNLVEKPKTVKTDAPRQLLVPQPGVLEPDAELLAEIGKRYAELTGNKTKSAGVESGSFQAWAYFHRGLWSLAIHPWDIPLDGADKKAEGEKKEGEDAAAKTEEKPDEKKDEKKGDRKDKREPSDDAKRLKWLDLNAESARFVAWHEFEHPELGRVEIGGFAPFARTEPPAAKSREVAQKELAFLLTLGAELARLSIDECTASKLGDGLWEVKAAVANRARLPLQSASARRTDTVRPARVVLDLRVGSLVAGQSMTLVRELGGSGARAEMRWLVNTEQPMGAGAELTTPIVRVDTDNAGTAERRPEVK